MPVSGGVANYSSDCSGDRVSASSGIASANSMQWRDLDLHEASATVEQANRPTSAQERPSSNPQVWSLAKIVCSLIHNRQFLKVMRRCKFGLI